MDSVHGAAKHHKHNKTTRKLLQESAKKRGKNVSQVLIIIIEEFSRSKQASNTKRRTQNVTSFVGTIYPKFIYLEVIIKLFVKKVQSIGWFVFQCFLFNFICSRRTKNEYQIYVSEIVKVKKYFYQRNICKLWRS